MAQPEVSYSLSWKAVAFVGIGLQAAAVGWIYLDWKMSQYQHADWRKKHRQSEAETLRSIAALWAKFGGPAEAPPIVWDNVGASELEDVSKMFPTNGDDDTLKARKIGLLTIRYGIGPSDADFVKIRGQMDHLALLRRGVADYRTFLRRKTFQTALNLMILGFALQLLSAWPSHWFNEVENQPATKDLAK